MPSYSAGTITLTAGSPAVVGVGTDFVANADAGYLLRDKATAQTYPILSITDATHLTLEDNVLAAAAGAGRAYSIIATSEPVRTLTERVGELVDGFDDVRADFNAGTLPNVALTSRRTDNTATFVSHIDLKRGSGAGVSGAIRTRGDAANGIDYIDFAFGGISALNVDRTGAVNINAVVPASGDAQLTFNRGASTVGIGVGRQTAFALNAAGSFVTYGLEQYVIRANTTGGHSGSKLTYLTKGGTLRAATEIYADEHSLYGDNPYYSLTSNAGVRMGYIQAVAAGNVLAISNDRTGPITFSIGNIQKAAIDSSGFVYSGTGSVSNACCFTATNAVNAFGSFSASGGFVFAVSCSNPNNGGWNGSASVGFFTSSNSTGRSISAAGTINSSGADYAEYHRKALLCGTILKGEIVGLNAKREIVDTFAEAVRFRVKSTDPNFVGGDRWAQHLGLRPAKAPDAPEPEYTGREKPPEDDPLYDLRLVAWAADQDAHAAKLVAWEAGKVEAAADLAEAEEAFDAAIEDARSKVDRLAYAGQVPAIISGAVTLGDYVVAEDDGDGGIRAVCAAEPSAAQRRRVVGYVAVSNPTEEDFRALIRDDIPLDPAWTAIVDVMQL